MNKANLEVFSETLIALAAEDINILVVTSDSRGSAKLVPFGERFPDQIIEVGIAEQSLVGVSAGLASCGKNVFAVSPACFLTARALEQIKNDVAYSDNPVKLVGISAGVSYGALGSTHHSLHDFAVLRAINNITIVAPADNFETRMVVEQAKVYSKPMYIRFGKKTMPANLAPDSSFDIGKSRTIREGDDAVIIAIGECVYPAFLAAKKLEKDHGIETRVISMHTIKPLDISAILQAATECKVMVTVEEHSVYGGLGDACAAFLLESGISAKFRKIAIPDEYTVTGSQIEIFNHYGISQAGISEQVLQLLNS